MQFRHLSGLFEDEPAQLALTQGGGYITGEIDKGVTGSGACASNQGIAFNDTLYKIGNITSAESGKEISNQLTWRLCSGGDKLPSGPVDATADVRVTFN